MTLRAFLPPAASSVSPEQQQSLMQAMLLLFLAGLAVLGHSMLTAGLGLAGLFWISFLTVIAMFVNLEFTFALMMCLLFLQNAFVAIAAPLIPNIEHFQIMLGGSMLNLFLLSSLAALTWMKWRSRMPSESNILLLWLLLFFVTVLFYTGLGATASSFSNAIIYGRVYLTGILMLIIGVAMGMQVPFSYMINIIRIIALILVVWGIAEFTLTYDFYSFFNILDFLNLKSSNFDYSYNLGSISELISNDTNSYLNLSGQFGLELELLRPKGPNIHTISYAYALAFCCLICFTNRFHLLSLACFAVALLVGAKGPLILIVASIALCLFYEKTRNRLWLLIGLVGCMAAYLAGGLIYGIASSDYHVLGFIGGLNGFLNNPLGHGIGVGGNMSTMGIQDADFETYQHLGAADFALESAFGVMLYQLGIGTVLFLVFYWQLWKNVWKAALSFSSNPRFVLVPMVLGLLLVNSIFQEEAFSPLGWGLWLLFGGLMLGKYWMQTRAAGQN